MEGAILIARRGTPSDPSGTSRLSRSPREERLRILSSDHRAWSRWKDCKKKVDWPPFLGYCFARFDPGAAANPDCPGVVTIVLSDSEAPIPDQRSTVSAVWSRATFTIRARWSARAPWPTVSGPLGRRRTLGLKGHTRGCAAVDLIGQAVSVADAADVSLIDSRRPGPYSCILWLMYPWLSSE